MWVQHGGSAQTRLKPRQDVSLPRHAPVMPSPCLLRHPSRSQGPQAPPAGHEHAGRRGGATHRALMAGALAALPLAEAALASSAALPLPLAAALASSDVLREALSLAACCASCSSSACVKPQAGARIHGQRLALHACETTGTSPQSWVVCRSRAARPVASKECAARACSHCTAQRRGEASARAWRWRHPACELAPAAPALHGCPPAVASCWPRFGWSPGATSGSAASSGQAGLAGISSCSSPRVGRGGWGRHHVGSKIFGWRQQREAAHLSAACLLEFGGLAASSRAWKANFAVPASRATAGAG